MLRKSSISRRSMVASSAAVLLAQSNSKRLHGAPKFEDIQTISQGASYCGWPTLARRSNGELIVVYSGSREGHVCPFGRLELIRSQDDGRSWSWPQVIMDTPIDDRDGGIMETAAGTLLATTFTSLAYQNVLKRVSGWDDARLKRWQSVDHQVEEQTKRSLLDTWVVRSTDGGMTWGNPIRCPLNSPHGPLQLRKSNRILYVGKKLWTAKHEVGVAFSDDDGQTWHWLSEIPTRPMDKVQEYHELHAVETKSGKLVAHIRNHNPNNADETLQTESADGGQTWSVPHAIGVWGLPSHLMMIRDGRLVMSYGYRRTPLGNQARVSEDEGETWSEPIAISDDGSSGDLGYPSTVELADGSLYTVWYEKMPTTPNAILRGRRWQL